jgi:pyruvate/2-oxoglutarate dehydrogenase complex dihydrolipoamide acyltransferase (E2) component
VTALAVAVTEALDRIAIAPLGESAYKYRLDHPDVIQRVRDRLHGADAIVIHGAPHWLPRLIKAGLAPRSATSTVVCTQLLAQLGRPNSVAANGTAMWDIAAATAGLVAMPESVRPAGPLGIPRGEIGRLAEATAAVLGPAFEAAENRLSRPLIQRAVARMRAVVSGSCINPETDSPVTDSAPMPVPVAVAGVTRSQFTGPPQVIFKRVSMVEGIAPEVALYEPAKKVLPPSPSVVALAAEHGIDLTELEGSGVGGRVILADVKRALKERT